MSFAPLETTSRSAAGCKFGISIHPHSKTKPGAGGSLQISIHPDVEGDEWKDGTDSEGKGPRS